MDQPPRIEENPSFPSTSWSMVCAAASPNDAVRRAALENLCGRYWYPVYAYFRRLGEPYASAQDLTQSFFTHILEKPILAKADPEKGSFKAYLFGSCKNFRINEWKKAKHNVLNGAVSLGDLEPPGPDPEARFDGDWARALLTNALNALYCRYAARGEAERFNRLRPYLPLHDGELPGPQAQAAVELGLSVEAYKKALHDLRVRFCQQVRHEMAQTLSDPAAVDEEIQNLLDNLRWIPSAAHNCHPAPEARR